MADLIAVVDYGSGNTFSMVNALESAAPAGAKIRLTNDPAVLRDAARIVLPGVGAFAECRRRLDASGVLPTLTEAVRGGRPFLGVCVGMQILAEEGREFGSTPGLGWISGVTRRLTFPTGHLGPTKLPHVGWTKIQLRKRDLFDGIHDDDHFYFVHSYTLECRDSNQIAAEAEYGETFTASVLDRNIFGCQFHPEKSSQPGLRVLENFCRWIP